MTKVVNDTDKLTYILTEYGLARVAEALADTSITIVLTKIKVGDANYEYYEPQENATALVNPIPNGEFNIVGKELLEDRLTISLRAFIPETFDNCEIREVGIYETVDGEDKLFALSTQQPLVKPSTDLYYFSTVDYYAFLKAQNLAEVYDQILLDPDEQLVTQEQLQELMRTIAFTGSNLIEQINGNSRVIGLNRAEQLRQKIETSRTAFGYTTAYNIYSLLLNAVDQEDIFGYWLFNYPRRTSATSSVTDISPNRRNLSTNKPINTYQRVYNGIMPMLKFNTPNAFYLSQSEGITKYNEKTFTKVGEPNISDLGVASGFDSNNYLKAPNMTTQDGDTGALYFNFSINNDSVNQSILYTENPYTFESYYDCSTSEFYILLGNGTQWFSPLYFPVELGVSYTVRILFNNDGAYLSLLENGTYNEKVGVLFTEPVATNFGGLVIGEPHGSYEALSGSTDLKAMDFRINGIQIFSGSVYSSSDDMSFLTNDRTEDTSFSMIFAVEPLSTNSDRTLLARSNYSTNTNIFEVTETTDNTLKIRLFSDANNYVTFESFTNTIPKKAHSVAFNYDAQNKSITAFAGGHKLRMNKTHEGNYRHMNDAVAILYAFTYTENYTVWANSDTNPTIILNDDGTPYTGTNWSISDNKLYYGNIEASYKEELNKETDTLYEWGYNDGLDNHIIYTKELELTQDTVLYNRDYTPYTGYEFNVIQSGTEYIIQYYSNTTEYIGTIPPEALYAYYCEGDTLMVWANNSAIPSVLYNADGSLYTGSDFFLRDNIIYYKDGQVASYKSIFNVVVPSLPVTSYVTAADGKPEKLIDSNVGVVVVLKTNIEEKWLRAFSLNLESALGNNPCITV